VPHDGGGDRRPDGGHAGMPARGNGRDDLVLWIAVGVDTVLAIVDAFTPVVLINLLIVGPLVAAFRTPPRKTAAVAAYALGLALYEGIPHGIFGSRDHLVRCAAIAATGGLAVWGSWQRARIARAEARAALLARAGAILGGSLRLDETLPAVGESVVPAAADRLAVDVLEGGDVRRVAAAPRGAASSDEADEALLEVLRTGEPVLRGPLAVLPLCARDETIGALTFVSAAEPPEPGSPALGFAEEVAVECAAAIDRSRLDRELRESEEALRRSNDQLGAILGGVADGVIARDATGRVVYANRTAAMLLGQRSADALQGTTLRDVTRWVRVYDESGSVVDPADMPGARLLRGEGGPDRLVRFEIVETGLERWILVKARGVRAPDGELRLVLLIFEDVTERTRRERGERFLAEGSKVLAGSLDYEATLRTISALVVPELADLCAIDVAGPAGAIRNVATMHVDPARVDRVRELRRRHPPSFAEGGGVAEVLRTGRPQLYPTMAAVEEAVSGPEDTHVALVRELGLTSAIVVPLAARGRTLGAMTLATDGSGRRFDADDLALAEELARRCALAVDNARLYGERSHVARTLQGSLVPAQLPRVPGFEVAARFHAAGEDVQVGGDFFDVFETDDGGWAAVIGDVSGKGADAAAVTALARYTVRAVAVHGRRASTVLRELNDAVLRHNLDDRFCTAAFARLRGGGGADAAHVQLCSGGHPLPLLVTSAGEVRVVGQPGTALGIAAAPRLLDREVALRPGDKLVFVTDGVIEARVAGRMLGVDGLERLLAGSGGLDAVATGERIEEAILGEAEPRDDIAVLVLRATGAGVAPGREGLVRSGAMGRERALDLRLPGGAHAPASARAAVEALPAGTLEPPLAHTARLLASEIVTNSVRHAGIGEDGLLGFELVLSPGSVRVEVSDRGPGFVAEPALPGAEDLGGRGLFLVDSLADRWGTADGGTRVWFELDRAAR
jgi:PAS domain S-box-containing protein